MRARNCAFSLAAGSQCGHSCSRGCWCDPGGAGCVWRGLAAPWVARAARVGRALCPLPSAALSSTPHTDPLPPPHHHTSSLTPARSDTRRMHAPNGRRHGRTVPPQDAGGYPRPRKTIGSDPTCKGSIRCGNRVVLSDAVTCACQIHIEAHLFAATSAGCGSIGCRTRACVSGVHTALVPPSPARRALHPSSAPRKRSARMPV